MNALITNLPHALKPLAVATKVVTISNSAGTLPSLGSFTFDAKCEYVQVAIKTANVNVDPSGNNPTATDGQPVLAGQVVLLSIAEATTAKWIRQSSDAAAHINQYTT